MLFFYAHYAVSYRDLEEILAKRGVQVGHAMLNRLLSVIATHSPAGQGPHQFTKKITRLTLGFKAFHSAVAARTGIEVAHMI